MVPELFDVVHQAVQLPLPIHLLAPAQGEAGEPLVVVQLAEHRLDACRGRRRPVLCVSCPACAVRLMHFFQRCEREGVRLIRCDAACAASPMRTTGRAGRSSCSERCVPCASTATVRHPHPLTPVRAKPRCTLLSRPASSSAAHSPAPGWLCRGWLSSPGRPGR